MLIYFGGKFSFRYKDYSDSKLGEDYRSVLIGVDSLKKEPAQLPKITDTVTYAGPFYFYEKEVSAEEIVAKEANTVVNADACFFYLDKDSAQPGTVTEIVNAALHKKIIKIFYVSEKIDKGEPEREIKSPLWYPIMFARTVNNELTTVKGFPSPANAIDALVKTVWEMK